MPPFTRLEFHREGIGLVPQFPGETDSAIYLAQAPGEARPMRSCTCKLSRKKTCDHLRELSAAVAEVEKTYGKRSWGTTFAASVWHRLARLFFDADPQASAKVRVLRVERDGGSAVRVTSPRGELLAQVLDAEAGQTRFLERTGKVAAGAGIFDRAELLDRLALFQATPQERALAKAGMPTLRQSWEQSFWHRLAYHAARELEAGESGTFHPAIDEATGAFTLTFRRSEAGPPMVQLTVPRPSVQSALKLLAETYPKQKDLAIKLLPLRSIFLVSEETELDVAHVRPVLRTLQATGEERFLEMAEVEQFRYGNLVWLKDLEILAEIERTGKERKFKAPPRLSLARSQIPGFLDEHAAALGTGDLVLDAPLRDRRIWKVHDRLSISAADFEEALERSWYWLALEYGFGSQTITLAEILAARRQGLPYLEVPGGWIDLGASAFRDVEALVEDSDDGRRVRLSASELLRLQARSPVPLTLDTDVESSALLERLLHLRPASPFQPSAGLATTLRPYQRIGVEWLRFLLENRLGGLLCDDMGLGKTLQTLALFVGRVEEQPDGPPFLVVCPTSVLSHWRDQILRHAPALSPILHHGTQRRLPTAFAPGDVVVTTYGVLRRDVEALAALPFGVAVFDEIQQLKNRQTQAWQAATQIVAEVRLGLSGTPIENSLADLKTLFDLVLRGYLGTDAEFQRRYLDIVDRWDRDETEGDPHGELRRVVSPFVLRRLKSSVLEELPDKFEDLRTCTLSDDQVKLYRDAVGGKGSELAAQIERAGREPLPYIHVFALLNLLKQICDHPALALGQLDRADAYASGKWDLFQEILDEALGSGQKVVVFTQFLGMIRLMERLLVEQGVGHVTLTGATHRRGEVVDRFNRDPDCRVFLGSLKAGGTGIDLVGGSVVIHYDRWWNAAREDQATDRVHRIGQHRAVQVFKLITEGTLEEKISGIIDRKRKMMASVVTEDDPKLAKIFTREEILAMLKGE